MTTMLDARRNFFRLSYENLSAEGYLYFWRNKVNINTGNSATYSFVTDPNFPVVLKDMHIAVDQDRSLAIQIFSGGVMSGGSLIPISPRNFFEPKPSPYVLDQVYGGPNIDVQGTLLFEYELGAQDNNATILGEGNLILDKDTQIYMVVTNNEEDAAVTTSVLAATLT